MFAAGDIVEFPLFINDNTASNVQHWQMANQHGKMCFAIGQIFMTESTAIYLP